MCINEDFGKIWRKICKPDVRGEILNRLSERLRKILGGKMIYLIEFTVDGDIHREIIQMVDGRPFGDGKGIILLYRVQKRHGFLISRGGVIGNPIGKRVIPFAESQIALLILPRGKPEIGDDGLVLHDFHLCVPLPRNLHILRIHSGRFTARKAGC